MNAQKWSYDEDKGRRFWRGLIIGLVIGIFLGALFAYYFWEYWFFIG